MRKSRKVHYGWSPMLGIAVLLAVFVMAYGADAFMLVSHAASAGKVTASSANIRKEPSAGSDSLGGVVQDAALNIKGQTSGSDGYTWYQVEVDGVTGYVRSDLVEITDGSTPPTVVPSTPSTAAPTTPSSDENLVAVNAVEPVGGKVKGASPVRVRQNASTTSRIVTTAEGGLALTVTGQADGTDGNQWYQVEYISNGSEVKGFIRSDYVDLNGELIPAGTGTPDEPDVPPVTEPEPVKEVKDWDTYYEGGKWHLINNTTGSIYDPQKMLESVEANTKILDKALSKSKWQQVIIILLVILLIGMATVVSYLIFKIKDMNDSTYFSEIERETIRRRTADRPQGNRSNPVQTVKVERRPVNAKPSEGGNGPRPSGGGNGPRPSGGGNGPRPSGNGNGPRPSGGGNGPRPSGNGNGPRPSGNGNGPRPSDYGNEPRPSGNDGNPQGYAGENTQQPEQRAVREQFQEQPVQESFVQNTPAQNNTVQQEQPVQKSPSRKARSAMLDDEEYEITFLDWDGKSE